MYKVIVAGSRGFNDYDLLDKELTKFLLGKNKSDVVIVSGTARGADKLGELFAKNHGCEVALFPADWDTYGKRAGYIRNADMAKFADACVVFWDGTSRGTKHMIDLANKENLKLHIVKY